MNKNYKFIHKKQKSFGNCKYNILLNEFYFNKIKNKLNKKIKESKSDKNYNLENIDLTFFLEKKNLDVSTDSDSDSDSLTNSNNKLNEENLNIEENDSIDVLSETEENYSTSNSSLSSNIENEK